jgi:hypothetical protein
MTTPRNAPEIAIAVAALLLASATVARFLARGGPFFDRPRTIVDHVQPMDAPSVANPLRAPLEVIPRFAPRIPRGATVTCFRPVAGREQYDAPSFLTAIGQLPRNRVLPPFVAQLETPVAQLPDYVIAIEEPFAHPSFRLIAGVPGGRLYQVVR